MVNRMLAPDAHDVVTTAVEGAIKGALAPLHDVLRDLAGPAAVEIGESFGERFRLWRISNSVKYLTKLQRRLEPIGIHRRDVALKLLVGVVEHGTMEEEDELQDMWATLLASEADAREPHVHPSFPDILHQLTARDARLLMLAARMQLAIQDTVPYEPVKIMDLRPASDECGFDPTDTGAFEFYVSAETLIRVRLLESRDVTEERPGGSGRYGGYLVTNLGWAFLRAVLPPGQYKQLARVA